MKGFNEARTTSIEQKVIDKLHTLKLGEFKKATGKYSAFDAFGRDNENKPVLIEIKERSQWYPEMLLCKQKFLDIFNIGKKAVTTVEYLLVLVVDDEMLLYDLKDIWIIGKERNNYANTHTSSGFQHEGVKKMKKQIYFPKDWYKLDLTEGSIGPKYQFQEA